MAFDVSLWKINPNTITYCKCNLKLDFNGGFLLLSHGPDIPVFCMRVVKVEQERDGSETPM